MRIYMRLLLGLVGRALHSGSDLLTENLVVRQRLAVYALQSTKPRLQKENRIFWSAVARGWRPCRVHLRLV